MALIKCPECDQPVSDSAKICPHCGVKLKHIDFKKILIAAVSIIISLVVLAIVIPYFYINYTGYKITTKGIMALWNIGEIISIVLIISAVVLINIYVYTRFHFRKHIIIHNPIQPTSDLSKVEDVETIKPASNLSKAEEIETIKPKKSFQILMNVLTVVNYIVATIFCFEFTSTIITSMAIKPISIVILIYSYINLFFIYTKKTLYEFIFETLASFAGLLFCFYNYDVQYRLVYVILMCLNFARLYFVNKYRNNNK